MAEYKLEEGMKNHPGFLAFQKSNTNTNVEEIKEDKKSAEKDDK